MHWQLRQLLHLPAQEERRLIQAAQNGSHDAFNALWRLHEGPLRGFVQNRVRGEAMEDILQEIRLGCWQSLPRYTTRARFKAWLFAIACNKCADYHRAGQHHKCEQSLSDATVTITDPTDSYSRIDARLWAQGILEALPAEQREVMQLYYYGELTLAEIATVLERNLNTVKAQFYRAHARAVEQMPERSRRSDPVATAQRPGGAVRP